MQLYILSNNTNINQIPKVPELAEKFVKWLKKFRSPPKTLAQKSTETALSTVTELLALPVGVQQIRHEEHLNTTELVALAKDTIQETYEHDSINKAESVITNHCDSLSRQKQCVYLDKTQCNKSDGILKSFEVTSVPLYKTGIKVRRTSEIQLLIPFYAKKCTYIVLTIFLF